MVSKGGAMLTQPRRSVQHIEEGRIADNEPLGRDDPHWAPLRLPLRAAALATSFPGHQGLG